MSKSLYPISVATFSMWPDWKQRVEEIADYADLFERERYSGTARWLRYLAQKLSERKPVANLEADLEETRATFKSEFCAGGPVYGQLYAAVAPAVNFMVTRPSDQQLKFTPLFQEIARNAQNLTPIDEAFKPFPMGRVRFYGMCFVYLINAEGMFDAAVRLLYGLVCDVNGKSIGLQELNRKSLKTIKRILVASKAPEAIFDGWEDGHVRNAVAHCRFYYDEGMQRIKFQDVDLDTGVVNYDRSFSIEEFGELYTKMDNVWHVISHLIFMTRVLFLVLVRDIPNPGRQLPLKG